MPVSSTRELLASARRCTAVYNRFRDARIALGRDGGTLVATFRGTNCARDVAACMQVAPRTTRWGAAHAGVLRLLDAARPAIERAAAQPGVERVLFEGHSLGGCLAVAAARTLELPGARALSFGAPRFADAEFLDFDGATHVVLDADPVPLLIAPPWFAAAPTEHTVRLSARRAPSHSMREYVFALGSA